MKTFLTIFALFAAISVVVCDTQEEKIDALLHKFNLKTFQKYVKDSDVIQNATAKLEDFCPGSSSKIIDGLSSLADCAASTRDNMTVCAGIRTELLKCTTELIKAIEDCMPPPAKGLPTLMMKSFVSGFNYACGLSGEELFELWNDCLTPDEDNAAEIEKCKTSLESQIQGLQSGPPSTSNICRLSHDARPCFQSYIKTSCVNQITRNTFNGMYDAVVAPCSTINEVKN